VTHPDDPTQPADEAFEPAPAPPSLSDRLAQLEPDDDEPLFDEDPYDDPYAPAAYGDLYTPQYAEAAPTGEPATAYDDSAFAEVGEPQAVPGYEAPVAAEPYADQPYAADPYGDQPYAADVDAPYADQPYADQPYADQPYVEAEPGAIAASYADPVPEQTDPSYAEAADATYATEVLSPAAAEQAQSVIGTTVVPPQETTAPGKGGRARSRRRGRRRIGLPVVALLLMTALMAAATGYLWLQVRDHDRRESARRSGLEASRDAARLLFSYDYRTLDKDFATGRELTTGEFRKQYEKTTTKVVSDVAKQVKAVVKANVVSAGVVRATPDTVVTVVYVNQVTTSTRVTGEKLDLSRVRMTLRSVGGRWLVDRVDAL
jgi:Mce-associated membrane protein